MKYRQKNFHNTDKNKQTIDYKDIEGLKNHINISNRIIPCRITGVSAKCQRKITQSIKLARFLALLPYCHNH